MVIECDEQAETYSTGRVKLTNGSTAVVGVPDADGTSPTFIAAHYYAVVVDDEELDELELDELLLELDELELELELVEVVVETLTTTPLTVPLETPSFVPESCSNTQP